MIVLYNTLLLTSRIIDFFYVIVPIRTKTLLSRNINGHCFFYLLFNNCKCYVDDEQKSNMDFLLYSMLTNDERKVTSSIDDEEFLLREGKSLFLLQS
ncbi:hypothetical protein AVEN_157003-1 [Araneus ventricosus]|uniref:Uncharacterized protein n=1 Tax=Araneus ventricosus TaxID=182803 RepID=A0A4Y2DCS4_ARAVE|nr:hypothetical protein AVEN_157003-1 [Araneus ventricosus]